MTQEVNHIFSQVLLESVKITLLVFVMMIVIDLLNVVTKSKLEGLLRGRKWRQYVVAPVVGAVPGCFGMFTDVTLYVHGLISFGALAGAMMAGSGDEAYVMLTLFPQKALLLFAILTVIGISLGPIVDLLLPKIGYKPCEQCAVPMYHVEEQGWRHYVTKHIWSHILKRHLWKVFLWTFGALLLLELGLTYWHISEFTTRYPILMFFIAAAIGLIPESGPHMIIVTMFAEGLIPFSVLVTSSIVQDGHGLLPLLSYSWKDSLVVKGFNAIFGLGIGLLMYAFGS
ncbi:MAG: putative manganese transporter [Bacteroidota bacterium]